VNATTNYSTAGLTYQWYSAPTGSVSYTALTDGGQYSGTKTGQLTVASVNANLDFIVVVTDGAGSVTSAPPARLTVIPYPPTIITDTTITPSLLRSDNNVPVTISADVFGTLPMSVQWKKSANSSGIPAAKVSGATSQTLTLSNPQPSDTGYYSLAATNAVGGTNTAWVLLTVLPGSAGTYHWAAPVQYATASPAFNLTAGQILTNVPGKYLDSWSTHGAGWPVTVGGITYAFINPSPNNNITLLYTEGNDDWGGDAWEPGWGLPGSTGNANMDDDIGVINYDSGVQDAWGNYIHQWQINNLDVGAEYNFQMFGADNRSPENERPTFYEDPNDQADITSTWLMGDFKYVVATFVATNSTMAINQVLSPSGSGNSMSSVLHLVACAPPAIVQSGANVQVSWLSDTTLLQATNILGPWTTNTGPSPITLTPSPSQKVMFFKTHYTSDP